MKQSWKELQETAKKLSEFAKDNNIAFFCAKQVPKDRLVYLGWFPEENNIQFIDYTEL